MPSPHASSETSAGQGDASGAAFRRSGVAYASSKGSPGGKFLLTDCDAIFGGGSARGRFSFVVCEIPRGGSPRTSENLTTFSTFIFFMCVEVCRRGSGCPTCDWTTARPWPQVNITSNASFEREIERAEGERITEETCLAFLTQKNRIGALAQEEWRGRRLDQIARN